MENLIVASGGRKTSKAVVCFFDGTGKIIVNKKPLEAYFPDSFVQADLKRPLVKGECAEKYDIKARVAGGGKAAQAEAVRLAISRALVKLNGDLRGVLREEELFDPGPPDERTEEVRAEERPAGLPVDKALKVARPPLVAFLDRDGVICRYYARDFTKCWEEFEFLPGAREALKLLNQAGARVAIISNQSGVGKGIYSARDLEEIDRRMKEAVVASGGRIEAAFYCPHTPAESCLCRKPGIGLVKEAVSELKLNLGKSAAYFVGDSETDIITGHRAGLITILVLTGQTILAKETESWAVKPNHIAPDLMGALKYIL